MHDHTADQDPNTISAVHIDEWLVWALFWAACTVFGWLVGSMLATIT